MSLDQLHPIFTSVFCLLFGPGRQLFNVLVILATNIAETSVTIPGVKYVIDPGVVKSHYYNPCDRDGVINYYANLKRPSSSKEAGNPLWLYMRIIGVVSPSMCLVNSGRAGREGPGKCFRLYPESEFWKLIDSTVPKIKRCNLSNVVLQFKAIGFDDII
ncbi:hypothetical protein IEQ34_004278 [Dendrobium chrysotoxum]|uniref:RNA helicase n=1 Tax=Dendrobium chrysotoxum TaxID=161865 RepID=A0AAV7GZ03_DENCH|nr:hypothetical protein IEQ34_004278 [Dendrobium chrysotoxum]